MHAHDVAQRLIVARPQTQIGDAGLQRDQQHLVVVVQHFDLQQLGIPYGDPINSLVLEQ